MLLSTPVNITQTIIETINTIFSNLFSSIDNSIYEVLDDITFINSNIISDSPLEKILGTSTSSGLLIICNSLIFGLSIYYIISLILSHFINMKIQSPAQFIFKLTICAICINFSFYLCEKLIDLFSTISLFIRSIGEALFSTEICFSKLIENLSYITYNQSSQFDIFSVDGLLKSLISFGLFNLIFTYSLRYIMVKVFILLCPFAIISLINESTSYFFKAWIKSLISLLFIQVFVSIILLLVFSIDFSNANLFSKIICIGAIYSIMYSNHFVKELLGGISINVSSGVSNMKNMLYGGKYL